MSIKLLTKKNFYSDLFERNYISNLFDEISLQDNGSNVSEFLNKYAEGKSFLYSYTLVPNYLNVYIQKGVTFKKATQKQGFGVNLKGINTVDAYIKSQGSTNFKKVLFRSVNRLESSFNISYKMYFGYMERAHYQITMDALEQMISNRFQQRQGRNKDLDNWQKHCSQTLALINGKKASLFVIYNNEKPIEISLNYHLDHIMYSAISSFDLDYAKFSLGNIEIYKQLEWCLLNNMTFFDMGYGAFHYKKRWANTIYDFENYFISKRFGVLVFCAAFMAKYKFKTLNYLIDKHINDLFYDLIGYFKKPKKELAPLEYSFTPLQTLPTYPKTLIDISTGNFSFIRKAVYDYLYTSTEHMDDIKIFEPLNVPNLYLIEGKKTIVEIKF
tara:strand:- start:4109 stop:5263 length:1155 start_codon:yes stop_codon:yes gene_type:complete